MLGLISIRFVSNIEMYDFNQEISIGCKLSGFSIRLFFQACAWLNLLLTVDRLFFILLPNKYKYFKSKKKVFSIIIATYTFLCILNTPSLLFEYVEIFNNATNVTVSVCVASNVLSIVRELLSQIIGVYTPFILMFLTNIILIIKVMNSRNKFQDLKDNNYFAFPLIISNIFYILSFVPFSIFLILVLTVVLDPDIVSNESFSSFLALYETCATILTCYNYGFGLIVQIIFNRLFRKEFFSLFFDIKSILIKGQNRSSSKS